MAITGYKIDELKKVEKILNDFLTEALGKMDHVLRVAPPVDESEYSAEAGKQANKFGDKAAEIVEKYSKKILEMNNG